MIPTLLPSLLLALSAPAVGEDAPDAEPAEAAPAQEEPVVDLEEEEGQILVTARRRPEAAFLSSRAHSLVGSRDLGEALPRTAPEALWDTPGVFVQQTNHGGGSPIVRGLIGPQVLLMVDGVRLNNAVYRTGPLQYLNLVEPRHLDRIEVLRGPASTLYGSDAMGGVIQLFPLEPRDTRDQQQAAAHGGIQGQYATADRRRLGAGHFEVGMRGWGMLGGYSWKRSDELKGGGDIGEQPYSGYAQPSAMGSVIYRLPQGKLDGWHIRAGYLFSRIDDAGRTDKLYDANSLQIYDNTDHLGYLKLHFRIPALHLEGDLGSSYQHFFERKDTIDVAIDGQRIEELDMTRDEVTAWTLGHDLQLYSSLLDDRLKLHLGGEGYTDHVSASASSKPVSESWSALDQQAYPDGSRYMTGGGFLMADGQLLPASSAHQLSLGAGWRIQSTDATAPAQSELPAVAFEHLGHVFHASLQHSVGNTVSTAFTFSQGLRSPNLQEAVMLGDTGKYFHIPNPDLQPERCDSFELLTRLRVWRLGLELSGYHSRLDQLILREETSWEGLSEVDGKPVVRNVNGDQGLIWGGEAGLNLDLGRGLSLSGHASHTWGQELVSGGQDVPLSRIPPLFGMAKIRYDAYDKRLRAFIETWIRAAAKQDRLSPEDESDVRIPDGGTPGWWTWNFRTGFGVYKQTRVTLAAENLLNKAYKYHGSGLYAPGTNLVAGLEAEF